jgi:AraC-like DNA-binding protein
MNSRGRIPFKPTRRQRRRVELLAGEASEVAIAQQLGVSLPTLRKHFAAELEFGRLRVLADALERLDRAAAKGNVSAAKALVARKDPLRPATTDREGVRLGKKAEAEAEALAPVEDEKWAGLVH